MKIGPLPNSQEGMTLLEIILAIVIFGIVGSMLASIVMLFAGFEKPEEVDEYTLKAQSCAEVLVAIEEQDLRIDFDWENDTFECSEPNDWVDGGDAKNIFERFCVDIDSFTIDTTDTSPGTNAGYIICEFNSTDDYDPIEIAFPKQ